MCFVDGDISVTRVLYNTMQWNGPSAFVETGDKVARGRMDERAQSKAFSALTILSIRKMDCIERETP